MRKLFTFLAAVLLTATIWAQSPEKMSYQAVIRNSSDALVTNTLIGMEINIRQGSPSGTIVYTETQTPTTNANGLVSIEIGGGTGFNSIDWANDTYYIETKTDPAGGTTYTITGTSQLLSVPYALHAKTAETFTGTITETDPTFTSSQAANITATDITNLSNLSGVNTGDQDLSALATKTALGDSTALVRSEIPDVSGFLTSETDPIFAASVASGITGTDTTNWNNKQDQLVAGTNITIVGNTISATGGSSNDFYLGQDTLGGIVFYIYLDQSGEQHGLIVSKTETTAKWQNTGVTTNATRSWDGVYNMNLMSNSPAKNWVEDNFSTDWYLPVSYTHLTLPTKRIV